MRGLVASGMLHPSGGRMASAERGSSAAGTLEEELLRLLARQARRVPLPVFLSAAMIAGLAFGYVPTPLLAGWLVLVSVVLALRWRVFGRLATRSSLPPAERLRIALALSALNGVTHGLSLGFFPFLPEFERALQSMLLIAFAAGSVATTSGYMPLQLAYMTPVLVPLSLLWAFSPGVAQKGWIEYSTAGLAAMLFVLLLGLARDAFRLFRESFAIRLQQAELNRQLAAALEQAEAANRAKTRFLASASHDLRQPIHTLSLFGGALSMRPLDETSRDIVGHINTALEALTTQLDALLDISKLDAGVMRANPGPLDVSSFLGRLKQGFEPAARAKGLALELECPAGLVAQTDPALLERIVRNLLDNAVKYTDAGHVALRAEKRNGRVVLISISDSGRGIHEADQARVFEEFYQVDNPERDRTKGLGLGLAIVKRLGELLGIAIELDSAPGRGTTFRLTLPAAPREEARAAEPPAREPRLAAHVLVVDDEAAIRLGMRTLLEAMGCRAILADGTERALDAARATRPDLVLADFRLRGSDNGIAAVRAIRELYPGVPAILVSGDIAADRLREAEQAGIALLHKPVPLETLKRAIAEAIEG